MATENISTNPTCKSSDIIGLWFRWSVREGNYYKLLAKLTIGCNLVEILRGGRRLSLAHLMSSWEAICQIFTTVGGPDQRNFCERSNKYPIWPSMMKTITHWWKRSLKALLQDLVQNCNKVIHCIFTLCDLLVVVRVVWASDMGIRINCVFGEIYQKSIQAGATLGTLAPSLPPKLDTLWLEGIRLATNCKGVASAL